METVYFIMFGQKVCCWAEFIKLTRVLSASNWCWVTPPSTAWCGYIPDFMFRTDYCLGVDWAEQLNCVFVCIPMISNFCARMAPWCLTLLLVFFNSLDGFSPMEYLRQSVLLCIFRILRTFLKSHTSLKILKPMQSKYLPMICQTKYREEKCDVYQFTYVPKIFQGENVYHCLASSKSLAVSLGRSRRSRKEMHIGIWESSLFHQVLLM